MMTAASARLCAALGCLLIVAAVLLWRFDAQLDTLIFDDIRLGGARLWAVALSDLGSAMTMIPLGLAGVAWLLWRGRRQAALWLLATVASGRLVVELTKFEAARLRPDTALHWVPVTSASFPSSHSAGSSLTLLALCGALRAPRPLWAASAVFAVAVGFSRVALGVHWPSDVLAGWGFGLLWTALWSMNAPAPS